MKSWLLIAATLITCSGCQADPPVVLTRSQTFPGLGAAQGVTVTGGRVYLFGDARPGVLKEYRLVADPTARLVATGRSATLTAGGLNRINHPTGLAVRPGLPTFLGNTVTKTKEGRIYTIELEQLLTDGWADRAIINETLDDLAIQGARPEYVRWHGRWVIATSDYGPGPNFIRLYDPTKLATATRTSDPGVLLARFPCGPWVQSLHWLEGAGKLLIIQNQIEGRRWRITQADFDRADCNGQVTDFPRLANELEGYSEIAGILGIFVTSSRQDNVTFAVR